MSYDVGHYEETLHHGDQGNKMQLTQEEYYRMKKEQLEDIYQGTEIIYEEAENDEKCYSTQMN